MSLGWGRWVKPKAKTVVSLERSAAIVVTADSPVPFNCDAEGMPAAPVPNAVNVILKFPRAGIRIPIGKSTYISRKPDSTIAFTAEGPVLTGVELERTP